MRHHNDMAIFTIQSSTDSVPFPSHFSKSDFTIAAFDNFDHDEATFSGIRGSHDTVSVLFQEDLENIQENAKPKLSESKVQHDPKSFHVNLQCQELRIFHKPSKKADVPTSYVVSNDSLSQNKDLLDDVRSKDIAWVLTRLDFEGGNGDI